MASTNATTTEEPTCDCPGCTDDARYVEPVKPVVANDPALKDELTVCRRHVDSSKDGVETL